MILTWTCIITLIIVIFAYPTLCRRHGELEWGHEVVSSSPTEWTVVEALAEEHPYIVALLSSMKDYICTGSIITKRTVLTSGSCIIYKPQYVSVNTAIYSKHINNNTVFQVVSAIVHDEYAFDLKTSNPNVTKIHSNIGIVDVNRPFLALFINLADLTNTFAPELYSKFLTAVGFGELRSSGAVVLQYQRYYQTPCMNPKWYYCVCGTEIADRSYFSQFGIGGPVLLGSTVVGISSAPCGSLTIASMNIKYNIFTIIGPYMPWIEKRKKVTLMRTSLISRKSEGNKQKTMLVKYFLILILISKLFF